MFTHKKIWSVSYPIILSLLAQNIINITDTAFLGRVGEIELGASALGGVFYLAIFMLGFGFSTGSQVLIGRRNGEQRLQETAPVFMQGNAFLLVLGAVILFLSLQYLPYVLGLLIHSENVLNATVRFLDWRMYGIFFAFLNVMFRAFYVGITRTRALTISAVVMAVVNIFLDYAMIFGKFGFPAMGIEGAAIASVIAELFSVLFFVVYTFRTIPLKTYGFLERTTYNMKQLPHILNISVWTMIQYFVAVGTWFIFFLATEHLGERSLAISNIVRSVSTMLFMPVSAYGTTANTLVSNMMGEGRMAEVPRLVRKIVIQCMWLVAPIMLIIFLMPEAIMRVYTEDVSLIQASVPSMLILTSCYVLAAPGSVYFQFVSGTGNTRSALAIESATLLFYMLYVGIVAFRWMMPVDICWFSEHIYWGSLLIISVLYLKKADWQSKKI
ncbi:MAG: MATE family efflux transporter [Bacteroidales bacterium]